MNRLLTTRNKIMLAQAYENALSVSSNTYVGIGRPLEWGESDTLIPSPTETINTVNYVYKNLVVLKKITSADINHVVPRVDWLTGTVYSEYTENLELYSYDTKTALTGTANTEVGSAEVTGNNTTFTSELSVGEFVEILGNGISTFPEKKEIVSITNDELLTVNSAYAYTFSDNVAYKVINSYPNFAENFYVRNYRDQVFKCLSNNGGVASTVEPEINIGGDLPENQFIITSDGYKWKYLYTIPSGLKEKFFNSSWMPVISDNLVSNSAVNGRLDIFNIVDGGSEYQSGGSTESAQILSVVGDGTGASVTANVVDGVIVGINILNPGQGYTEANIIAVDATQLTSGDDAVIEAVIGPQNGHGFDPVYELGATNLMISVDLEGNEGGVFPTKVDSQTFDYRQVSLIRNIKNSEGNYAQNSTYKATQVVRVTTPPGDYTFNLDDIVYQGTSFENSTFSGTVCYWDSVNNDLWLNDTRGTFSQQSIGTSEFVVTALSSTDPEVQLYTGEVLYIENKERVTRDDDQTEQIKIVVSF